MFIDGLWISDITLSFSRENLTMIPDEMRNKNINIKLSPVQVNAIAALLGFGMKNGDSYMYTDDDLNKIIVDPDNHTFENDYKNLSSGIKANRRSINIFTPAVENPDINDIHWDYNENVVFETEYLVDDEDNSDDSDNKTAESIEAFNEEELKELHL